MGTARPSCFRKRLLIQQNTMKVTVKHNLIIFHKPHEWEEISHKLIQEYGPSIMISWKLRRELGFSVRRHKGLVKRTDQYIEEYQGQYYYEDQVHLDFFNSATQSWFQLKYLHL